MKLEVHGSVTAVAREWDALAHRQGASPFATSGWATSWITRLGTNGTTQILVCRGPDGEPQVVLPLTINRQGPLRVARWLGHGPADEHAPLCAPEDRELAVAALRAGLRGRADLLISDLMPGEGGWESLLPDATVLEREASPVLPLGRSWDEVLAGFSSNLRSQTRRRERRLERERGLTFRLTTDAATLDADLDTLFELHEARFGDESSTFTAGPARDFQREWAHQAFAAGVLRLWIAELDGRPAAAWEGFRASGIDWFYQSGRDPAVEDTSVGAVLLAHTIRDAAEHGARAYRFGRGDEAYKRRYATEDPGLVSLALPATARGRAYLAARALKRRVSGGSSG